METVEVILSEGISYFTPTTSCTVGLLAMPALISPSEDGKMLKAWDESFS